MQDWAFLVSVLLVLGFVAAWTVRVQRRHDSLAVLASAAALAFAVLPLCPLVVFLVSRTWLSRGAIVFPQGIVASAAALSFMVGPTLLVAGAWMRRDESLPFSTLILQTCHGTLWAILTVLGIGLAIDV